jgi:hypothetical protein
MLFVDYIEGLAEAGFFPAQRLSSLREAPRHNLLLRHTLAPTEGSFSGTGGLST